MDKIRNLFSNSKSISSTDEILAVETLVPSINTQYGKELNISKEEKSRLAESLTPRERDTYLLLLEGYTLKETAKQLSIGYSTANTYQTAVYRKLHINSRAELIINYRDIR
ncbi:MAG: helix-turn-helix transcriptional regulator [Lutisporaceae bacterium]